MPELLRNLGRCIQIDATWFHLKVKNVYKNDAAARRPATILYTKQNQLGADRTQLQQRSVYECRI